MRLRATFAALVLLLAVSCLAQTQPAPSSTQTPQLAERAPERRAGVIAALVPTGFRNLSAAMLRENVQFDDVLRTAGKGRMRVTLRDGSLLSLGSNTELLVVEHDPAAQKTLLGLVSGTLRGRVAPQVRPGARFRVHTPTAVVGVVGTDFYVSTDLRTTTVVCYSGLVVVGERRPGGRVEMLRPGQQIDIGNERRPRPRTLPKQERNKGKDETRVDGKEDADLHLEARLTRTVSTKKNKQGDEVTAKAAEKVKLADGTELPKGARLIGHVREVKAQSETSIARLVVVFDKAVTKEGQEIALHGVVQAVRSPYSSRALRSSELLADLRQGRRSLQRGGPAPVSRGEGGATASSRASAAPAGGEGDGSSGSGSGSGDDDSGDDSGSSGSGSDDSGSGSSGSGSGEDSSSDDGVEEGRDELEDKLKSDDSRDDGELEEGDRNGEGEVSDDHNVGDDDDLDESSRGVGGITAVHMALSPREHGLESALLSARENIVLESGTDLVLRLEEPQAVVQAAGPQGER